MKFKALSILLMFILFIMAGCSASKPSNTTNTYNTEVSSKSQNKPIDYSMNVIKNNQISSSNIVGTSQSSSDTVWSYDFNNIDNIINAADCIFTGTVEDIVYFDKGVTTYSILSVKANKVFYGSETKGDIIQVLEFGGYTTVYNRMLMYGEDDKEFVGISKEDAKNKFVEIGYEGCPLTKIGDQALFMGCSGYDKALGLKFPVYEVGPGQERKLIINGNKVERRGDVSLKKLTMNKADYEKTIEEKVKKVKKN